MTVRAVEGKKLWEGGTAITVDNENKVISLNLRDENNLIIYDEGDDEIYVDLQLPDGIRPTDAFPVGITTGRVLVADDWDVTGTLICAKTTSGDNIKVLYGDDNKLYVDNGTGIFKQVYLKPEVDALLATYATIAYVDAHDTVVSATAPETPTEGMLWYNTTTGKLKVYNGTDWDDVGGGGGSSYTAGNGIIIDQNDEISVDTTVVATQTDLGSKQDELVSGTNIKTVNSTSLLGSGDVTVQETLVSGTNIKTVNSNSLLGSGDVSINEVPSGGTDGQVLTKVSGSPAWANPTGGGGDVSVSTDTGNELTTGAKLWLGTTTDFSSIVTPDSNTMYIQYTSSGGGWQPGANTLAYYTLDNDGTNKSTLTSKFSDITLNTATYSTAKAHGNNTKSLYCDGSTYAYIPASALHEFGIHDLTISVWVYSLTNSGSYPGFLSCYQGSGGTNVRQGWRLSDRFNNINQANFCWNPGYKDSGTDLWYDGFTGTSIYGGWHNMVLTRESGVIKLYLDGNATGVTTSSYTSNNLGRNANINLGWSGAPDNLYSQVYMNDLIFENKGWTAQEVSDYYNLTS